MWPTNAELANMLKLSAQAEEMFRRLVQPIQLQMALQAIEAARPSIEAMHQLPLQATVRMTEMAKQCVQPMLGLQEAFKSWSAISRTFNEQILAQLKQFILAIPKAEQSMISFTQGSYIIPLQESSPLEHRIERAVKKALSEKENISEEEMRQWEKRERRPFGFADR